MFVECRCSREENMFLNNLLNKWKGWVFILCNELIVKNLFKCLFF